MAANGTALPVLRTPRLVIRPLGDADEDACRSVLAVPDEDGFRRWLTWAVAAPGALADLHQPPYGERAMVLAATGELVGLVGLVPASARSINSKARHPAAHGRRSSASTGHSPPRIAETGTRPKRPRRTAGRSSRPSIPSGSSR